jgi:hypothetical protein
VPDTVVVTVIVVGFVAVGVDETVGGAAGVVGAVGVIDVVGAGTEEEVLWPADNKRPPIISPFWLGAPTPFLR